MCVGDIYCTEWNAFLVIPEVAHVISFTTGSTLLLEAAGLGKVVLLSTQGEETCLVNIYQIFTTLIFLGALLVEVEFSL